MDAHAPARIRFHCLQHRQLVQSPERLLRDDQGPPTRLVQVLIHHLPARAEAATVVRGVQVPGSAASLCDEEVLSELGALVMVALPYLAFVEPPTAEGIITIQ